MIHNDSKFLLSCFCASCSCFPSIAADDAAEAAEVAAGGGAAKAAAKPKKKDDSMALLAEGLAATKVTKPKK